MSKSGSTYTLTTLNSFTGANGANPTAGLISDASGNLFGTTYSGGTNGNGTVFELTNTPFQVSPTSSPTPTPTRVPEPSTAVGLLVLSLGWLAIVPSEAILSPIQLVFWCLKGERPQPNRRSSG